VHDEAEDAGCQSVILHEEVPSLESIELVFILGFGVEKKRKAEDQNVQPRGAQSSSGEHCICQLLRGR
jgi:hypothetical protein